MANSRRWLQSAVEESRKPQPNMPWQQRKLAAMLPLTGATASAAQGLATA